VGGKNRVLLRSKIAVGIRGDISMNEKARSKKEDEDRIVGGAGA